MPLIPQERYQINDRLEYSSQPVETAQLALGRNFDELLASGVRAWPKKGKEQISTGVYLVTEQDYGPKYERLWAAREKTGHARSLTLRRRNDGITTFAEVSGQLPPTLSKEEAGGLYRSDEWHARFEFPAPKDGEQPRAVLDMWSVPYTQLSLLAMVEGSLGLSEKAKREQYDDLFSNLGQKSSSSAIPVAAKDHIHLVYGRPEDLDTAAQERLAQALGLFEQATAEAVAWNNSITAKSV